MFRSFAYRSTTSHRGESIKGAEDDALRQLEPSVRRVARSSAIRTARPAPPRVSRVFYCQRPARSVCLQRGVTR